MNLSAKKSSIHHHLTRPTSKKPACDRGTSIDDNDKSSKVESGFGPLKIGTEVLSVPAAYKSIFRL